MIYRDVTKSAVIIIIAVLVGAQFVAAPLAKASWKTGVSTPSPLPIRSWVWENGTFVVEREIVVQYLQTFKIRNATVEMHSKNKMIGITVFGLLEIDDSIIRSHDETGYYLTVFGAAIIRNSTIEGVRSNDPIGEGIIATGFFQLSHTTLSSYQDHAVTLYVPYLGYDNIYESDVQGVMVVNSVVNIKNSSVGNLYFRAGASEVSLWNSTYSSLGADIGFGFVYSYDYIQVHTSLPNANLLITDAYENEMNVGETDNEGYYRSWWLSRSMIVGIDHIFELNHNPHTFEASKSVEEDLSFTFFNGRTWKLSFSQDYYGVTVQDVEEDQFVEIEMLPI